MMLWFLVACQPEEQGFSQIALSALEVDFGEIPIGTWESKPLVLENIGTEPVQILSSSVIGASDQVWQLSSDGRLSLGAGDYSSFELRFEPVELGPTDVRVQIRLDMDDLPVVTVDAKGVGGLSVRDGDGDGYSPADGDCDDFNAAIYPAAEEVCDGYDNNCDDIFPNIEEDRDGDGWMPCSGDCDDQNADVFPNAPELCDDLDNDCDGVIPDNDDFDADGQSACDGDCDDEDPFRYLGNYEICDFIDNDCDDVVDDIDFDGDGHSACPSGGDCDDNDPLAYPVVFDSNSPYNEGTGSPQFPYKDLNSAFENLDDTCRTVMIAPGTHEIQSSISNTYAIIRGAGANPEDTTFTQWWDSNQAMLVVRNSAVVEIENLTFFGGTVPASGGGLRQQSFSTITARDVYFINNDAGVSGGGALVLNSTLTCIRCEFFNNVTNGDGGAVFSDNSVVTFEDSLFIDNSAQQGGALSAENSNVSIMESSFRSNTAFGEGGAISFFNLGTLESVGSSYWGNTASGYGGAISSRHADGPAFELRNNRFQDNSAQNSGGAIAQLGYEGALVAANNTFAANYATDDGADIYSEVPASDGYWLWSNIFHYSSGVTAVTIPETLNASLAFNICSDASTTCYDVPADADEGFNLELDPMFISFTPNDLPSDDDLTLQAGSPAIDSGPFDGQATEVSASWSDVDLSRNDRGYTGGPGGQ